MNATACQADQIGAEIKQRFGDVPTFFSLAFATPDVASALWQHTNLAYLDNPIPFLFKERLFVSLSRFCRAKYCVVRHAAMLTGRRTEHDHHTGRSQQESLTAEQVLRLLESAPPDHDQINQRLAFLEDLPEPLLNWPDVESEVSHCIFDCCVAIFLRSDQAPKCQATLRRVLGVQWYQRLAALMSFIRTALEWTQWHPDLRWEPNIEALLQEHQQLANWFETYSPDTFLLPWANESHQQFLSSLRSQLTEWNSDSHDGHGQVTLNEDDVGLLLRIQNLAMQTTRIGVLISDARQPDNPIVFCNAGFEKITGYRSDEVLGRNCRFLLGNDRDQQGIHQMRQVIEQGGSCQVVVRNYRKNGSLFWNEVTLSAIHNEQGQLTHFVGLQNDVTVRHQTHQALVRQRAILEAVIQGIPDALFLADMNREITYCNPAFSQVFGYRAEELIGRSMSILYADQEEYHLHAQRHLQADAELSSKSIRMLFRHQSGSIFPCEVVGATIRDAGKCPLGYLGLIRDIRDREQAADSVKRSEERLSLVVKATNEAIWDYDLVSGNFWCNNIFRDQFGSPAESDSIEAWWNHSVHPDDHGRVMEAIDEFIQGGEASDHRRAIEYRLRRLDGSYAVVDAHLLRTVDAHGVATRLLGALVDQTQRRALEKEVLEIAAAESCRIGSDLHDGIGQELTGMGMLADALRTMLMRDDSTESRDAQHRIVEKLVESTDRTLTQVRMLARGMNPVDVDRAGLMAALIELCERVQHLYDLQCEFVCYAPVLFHDGQVATHLYRIAQEAVNNAIKHGRASRIQIFLFAHHADARLEVIDNGIGMPENLDVSRGLGLRTMGYRANLVGGEMRISAAPQGGTRIACVFPRDAVANEEDDSDDANRQNHDRR